MSHYPEYAIQELKKVNKRLEQEFQRVWAVLSPTRERDTVMWHLSTARKTINDIINRDTDMDELTDFIKTQMNTLTLEESRILQSVLNKITQMEGKKYDTN